ncbi:tigger transposable element-derived protein 4-like, partial [Aphis craccivora]
IARTPTCVDNRGFTKLYLHYGRCYRRITECAKEFFSRGRHNKIDIFYLAQSYSKLIRDNSYSIVFFKQDETNLNHVYNEHFSGDMT